MQKGIYTLIMKKITTLLAFIFVVLLAACSSESKFTVEGSVSGADNKVLYFDASRLEGMVTLDSVKLNNNGRFKFQGKRPESPEFFSLRLEDKVINLSIDSTETVAIQSTYDKFDTDYSVEGSENVEKIKEITLLHRQLLGTLVDLNLKRNKGQVSNRMFYELLNTSFDEFKNTLKTKYIFAAPYTAFSYYALFLKANGYLILDPYNNRDDLKCFQAVATSLNEKYPHSDRAKNLYNITIKGMKNTRKPKVKQLEVPEDKVEITGIIDIDLRDVEGKLHKLSELKNKVVLLDFTIFQSPLSSTHIFNLREIYKKYASQGFEIYQVSLDADEHYWKTAADNLPWISVRDVHGVYSKYASAYNVEQLPAFFLIDKNSELVGRDNNIENLEKSIKSLL